MNETLLLDTDLASFLFKNSPQAKPFRPLLKGKRLALAFVSVAELFKWTVKRGWSPPKVAQLEASLRRYIVVPYDRDLAWAWARLVAACEDAGRPIATQTPGSRRQHYAMMSLCVPYLLAQGIRLEGEDGNPVFAQGAAETGEQGRLPAPDAMTCPLTLTGTS